MGGRFLNWPASSSSDKPVNDTIDFVDNIRVKYVNMVVELIFPLIINNFNFHFG